MSQHLVSLQGPFFICPPAPGRENEREKREKKKGREASSTRRRLSICADLCSRLPSIVVRKRKGERGRKRGGKGGEGGEKKIIRAPQRSSACGRKYPGRVFGWGGGKEKRKGGKGDIESRGETSASSGFLRRNTKEGGKGEKRGGKQGEIGKPPGWLRVSFSLFFIALTFSKHRFTLGGGEGGRGGKRKKKGKKREKRSVNSLRDVSEIDPHLAFRKGEGRKREGRRRGGRGADRF